MKAIIDAEVKRLLEAHLTTVQLLLHRISVVVNDASNKMTALHAGYEKGTAPPSPDPWIRVKELEDKLREAENDRDKWRSALAASKSDA